MARRFSARNDLIVAGLCALLAACSVTQPRKPALEIGVTDTMTHLDPARGTEPATIVVSRYVFTTLPAIATRVRRSSDAREWTFSIPAGIRFSDGTNLDAEAIAANFTRWRLGWFDPDGFFAYGQAFLNPGRPAAALVEVTALDRATLRIRTRGPSPSLPATLANPHFAIGSPTAFAVGIERFDRMPVGSGPYVIRRFVPDGDVELVPRVASDRGRYATIDVRDILDPYTSVLALDKNDVSVVYGFPPQFREDEESLDLRPAIDARTGLRCAFARSFPLRDRRCPPGPNSP